MTFYIADIDRVGCELCVVFFSVLVFLFFSLFSTTWGSIPWGAKVVVFGYFGVVCGCVSIPQFVFLCGRYGSKSIFSLGEMYSSFYTIFHIVGLRVIHFYTVLLSFCIISVFGVLVGQSFSISLFLFGSIWRGVGYWFFFLGIDGIAVWSTLC